MEFNRVTWFFCSLLVTYLLLLELYVVFRDIQWSNNILQLNVFYKTKTVTTSDTSWHSESYEV